MRLLLRMAPLQAALNLYTILTCNFCAAAKLLTIKNPKLQLSDPTPPPPPNRFDYRKEYRYLGRGISPLSPLLHIPW